jgi:hypothetical protein
MFAIFALTLAILLSFGVAAISCWLVLIAILRLTKCQPPAEPRNHSRVTAGEVYSPIPLPAIETESAPEPAPQYSPES